MLRFILVVLVLGVGFVAALRSRFAALQLYVWFALFRPQEWVWMNLAQYRLSTVLGGLLVIPCLLTGAWPVVGHFLSLGMLSFLGIALMAQQGATDPEIGWFWIDFLAKLILISLFAIRLTSTPRRLLLLVGTVAASFAFHSAMAGFGAVLSGGARYYGGTGGPFSDNNTYAVGCVMVLPLLIAFAQNIDRQWLKRAFQVAVPLTIVTIVSTYSRGGLLALLAAGFVFILVQERRGLLLACVAALVPVVLLIPLPEGYAYRVSTIGTYEEVGEGSALGRLHFWRVALAMAADRPLGVGLWNFESTYDQYDFSRGEYGTRRAVHNSHLQVLTETGWLGAFCWVTMFAAAFVITLRSKRRASRMSPEDARLISTVANALMASMFGFLVGGTFVSMAMNDLTYFTFAIVASLDRVSRQLVAGVPVDAHPALAVPAPGIGATRPLPT